MCICARFRGVYGEEGVHGFRVKDLGLWGFRVMVVPVELCAIPTLGFPLAQTNIWRSCVYVLDVGEYIVRTEYMDLWLKM